MRNALVENHQIRIDQDEIEKLRSLFSLYLERYSDAVVYLFGSRVDPAQKGGDLDLLILSHNAVPDAYTLTKKLRIAIKEFLGDQKIDIIITSNAVNDQPAFVHLALLDGVQIWP